MQCIDHCERIESGGGGMEIRNCKILSVGYCIIFQQKANSNELVVADDHITRIAGLVALFPTYQKLGRNLNFKIGNHVLLLCCSENDETFRKTMIILKFINYLT